MASLPKGQRHPVELRERATRMVLEHGHEYPSQWKAIESIAEKLGVHRETLRVWVRRVEVDEGHRPGLTTDERARMKELERVPELRRDETEVLVHKRFGDAYEDTTLETELARLEVGRVVVTGAQTDACIRATIHGAFARGYDTILVSDAHTTEDLSEYGLPKPDEVIAHTNMYWTWQAGPRACRRRRRDRRCQLRGVKPVSRS